MDPAPTTPAPDDAPRLPRYASGAVRFDPLEGTTARIARTIGLANLARLLGRHGGLTINIPARPEGTALADAIGEEAAASMTAEFGRGRIDLSCGELRGAAGRRSRALALLMDGVSVREVAIACDVHTRTVTNWRAALAAGGHVPPHRSEPPR